MWIARTSDLSVECGQILQDSFELYESPSEVVGILGNRLSQPDTMVREIRILDKDAFVLNASVLRKK